MDNITMHRVQKSDVEELQEVGIRSFLEAFGEMNDERYMKEYLDDKFSIRHLLQEIKNPASLFFFLKKQDSIIGYLKVNAVISDEPNIEGKSLEIQRIYLLSDYQGQGGGKILIEKALEIAKDQKVKTVWLGVWEKNFGAIRFYERYGFKAYDKHSFFLGPDEQTDLLMKLEL